MTECRHQMPENDRWILLEIGEVLEWLKRLAWKACIPQKGIEGSNPSLSAYQFDRNSKNYWKGVV